MGTMAAVSLFPGACKKPAPVSPPPPIVEVMEITTSDAPLSTTLIGSLDSPQNVEIRARVEGFVDRIPFTEGIEIEQGTILFELDPKPYLEKLAAAKGALAEAQAALNKYRKDVARLEPLALKRAIPQQDLDNANASVEVGQAAVLTAEAQVQSAQIDLGYCEIKAPVSGLIGATQVSIGELVGKGEPTLLTTMSTLDPIWFYCNVSEVDFLKAEQKSATTGSKIENLPLTLTVADGIVHPDKGSFVFIDRAVETNTGTIRIRAEFPNRQKQLRPGMFARVEVDLGAVKDTVQVPQKALVELQGKNFLWVISEDGKASQRPVTVGDQLENGFIILDGVEPGERVVVEGLQKVREGAPVKAMTTDQIDAIKAGAVKKPTGK